MSVLLFPVVAFWFGSCRWSYWYGDVPRARQTINYKQTFIIIRGGKDYVSFIISCSCIWFGSCRWSYWYGDVPRARQISLKLGQIN